MSAAEILSELPKLTEAERRAVRQKLAEMAAENEDIALCDQAAQAAFSALDKLEDDGRRARLNAFFAERDATHSVTVGEKPAREHTYADNPRLR